MDKNGSFSRSARLAVVCFALALALVVPVLAQDKTPVIIIPGITGSELVNSKTGQLVWFRASRPKDDGLRLPIFADPTKGRDDLLPGDIIRSVKFGILPRIDVYAGLIETLETKGGYHEEKWDAPTDKADDKAIYVFPYDWRLDNVGNARLLVKKIAALKAKLRKPNLKFNVIAHSMGGIIARYAAMFGDVDLPAGNRKPVVTWAGSAHFDKVVLIGTPNQGSAHALDAITNGISITGININLPWIQNLSKFDLFTIPAAFQLLPAPGEFRALDENFEPLSIDLYDPKEWTKYGWNVIEDRKFTKQFSHAEQKQAHAYFAAVLDRAKRLQDALASVGKSPSPVSISLVGSECKEALDTIVMLRDEKTGKWRTIFKPNGFTKSTGLKVSSEEMKKVMLVPGDGVVTKRSFQRDFLLPSGQVVSAIHPVSTLYVCEDHNKLATNKDVQDYLIDLFAGKKVQEKVAAANAGRNIPSSKIEQ